MNKIEKPSGCGSDRGCPLAIETSRILDSKKDEKSIGGGGGGGEEEEGDFPSCSFHVRRADTNTKRSLGFQTYPRLRGHLFGRENNE